MTKPLTMSWLPSPLALLTNCARPTVPPAPAMLMTCALFTSFSAVSACCIERAVWSQPPPGAAGAMIFSSICANAEVANKVAPRDHRATAKASTQDMGHLLQTPAVLRACFCSNVQGRAGVCDGGLTGEAAAVEEGLLLGRGGAAEHGVAVREAAEAADDVGVQLGPFQIMSASPVARHSAQQRSWSASASECSNGR